MSRFMRGLPSIVALIATVARLVPQALAQSKPTWMPARTSAVALVGGTVHAGDRRHAEQRHRGRRAIASPRSQGAGAAVPAGAQVIDCRGKHVYPGFVAANTQLGLTEVSTVTGSNDNAETGTLNPNQRAEGRSIRTATCCR